MRCSKSAEKKQACAHLLGWPPGRGSVELWLRAGCEDERCEIGMLLLLRRKPSRCWVKNGLERIPP